MAHGYTSGISPRASATIRISYYHGGNGADTIDVPITPRCIRKFMLMQEDFIQLEFSLPSALQFGVGDYIDDEIFGRFYITEEQMPKYNVTTGGYDYSLKFDANYMRWRQYIFMLVASVYDSEEEDYVSRRMEVSWRLTASLASHAGQIVKNLSRIGLGNYTLDITADKAAEVKFLQYNGANIIEAMNMMAEAWQCEWWVTGSVIHFGKCEGADVDDVYQFSLGTSVENMDISRDQQVYANRIYGYGGTRNIPDTYDRELIFEVTENGTDGFKDNSRPLRHDMIAGASTATVEQFTMASSASGGGASYSQKTDTKTLTGTQAIGGTLAVSMIMECDSWNAMSQFPSVAASLILHYGDSQVTLDTIANIIPYEDQSSMGEGGYRIVFNYTCSVDHTLSLNRSTAIFLEVQWLVVHHQQESVQTSFDGTTSRITATSGEETATKQVTITPVGMSSKQGTFYAETGLIKFNSGTPTNWGVGREYTLSPLTVKVPVSYYKPKYDTEGMSAVGEKRLHLPGNRYRDASSSRAHNTQELSVIFEDIYPQMLLRIKEGSIGTLTKSDDVEYSDGSVGHESWVQYSFAAEYYDSDTSTWKDYQFDTSWILDGQKLQAAFTAPTSSVQSGYQLSGMTFDVGYNNLSGRFVIIRNEDYGAKLPNELLKPSENDAFFLVGWNPQALGDMGLVTAAQRQLRDTVDAYLAALQDGQFTFNCRMMSSIWFEYNWGGREIDGVKTFGLLNAGAKVAITHASLPGGSKTSRVIGYEYKLDIPYDSPTYIVGETEAFSRLKRIEKQLTKL